jgi:hypothetical protein
MKDATERVRYVFWRTIFEPGFQLFLNTNKVPEIFGYVFNVIGTFWWRWNVAQIPQQSTGRACAFEPVREFKYLLARLNRYGGI